MKLSNHLPSLTAEQIHQLDRLADLFLEWNQKLNLSSIRNREGVLVKHILDSLLILPFGLIKPKDRVLDLGTGGGFPGLALAIAYPEANFTLVDATAKKISAVQDIIRQLNLKNARTLTGRAEELGRSRQLREHFDVVVARALAGFPTLLEYCMPFVKPRGKFIAYQGPELAESWMEHQKVAQELDSRIVGSKKAILPVENAYRCFIVVEKSKTISEKYPRRTGIPKKEPLA
ncbi:MAG: 16S rRNA (guanine(527)-N(7))-methyltransferase RsmG [bacterium]|nr:16S rRNA (guanine(527)-N(7))-methyltransferase RsmG [bacterium]